MRVSDIMSSPVITCHQDWRLEDAVQLMVEKKIGVLPVIDDRGILQGTVTENDFLPHYSRVDGRGLSVATIFGEYLDSAETAEDIFERVRTAAVRDCMNHFPMTLTRDTSLTSTVYQMFHSSGQKAVVVEEGRPVGVVSSHDVMKSMIKVQQSARCAIA
ncbi:CBS domain-containing protein [Pseudobacteriovorax antillogorgiicola]|uniref:CBS domain-containing protein n=1 Tax=Pseudobacteriovorax antillogorgiicola TaxID=1513793 RepID=A0A1Y6BC27_9BACT|nr:CBS domain-containing protein [Pseudobacteriovorax antillogorgiicola]TCS57508.1 CBS domain protein [Pseudobacteriovorax antillogorgiicola]SMF00253.1 CBS domain-containing protein [Pseudobacteriovorax antillogorgiicola]